MGTETKTKKRTFGTTMGVTSIIAILVILILIVFSALSITTSKADLNLANKTAYATTVFYKADTAAERVFAEISDIVANGGDLQKKVDEIQGTIEEVPEGQSIKYEIKIDSNKELAVELIVASDGQMHRKDWRVQTFTEWNADKDLNVVTEFPAN